MHPMRPKAVWISSKISRIFSSSQFCEFPANNRRGGDHPPELAGFL
jgi:hypothetical protein